jgi:hypothetical protein
MYLYIFFKNKMDRDQIRNLHKINILACLVRAGPCGGDKRPRGDTSTNSVRGGR